MEYDSFGSLGCSTDDSDIEELCYKFIIEYIQKVIGVPPNSCYFDIKLNEHDLGTYNTLALYCEPEDEGVAYDYFQKAFLIFEKIDYSIEWDSIEPEVLRENLKELDDDVDLDDEQEFYPTPDFSNLSPNLVKEDRDDPLSISFGFGNFNNGRPLRVEYWAILGSSYITIYFSSLEIENASRQELTEMLITDGIIEIKNDSNFTLDEKKIIDSSGNEMWMVIVLIGDEDDIYVSCPIQLKSYHK
jgi:hypothetical protein